MKTHGEMQTPIRIVATPESFVHTKLQYGCARDEIGPTDISTWYLELVLGGPMWKK